MASRGISPVLAPAGPHRVSEQHQNWRPLAVSAGLHLGILLLAIFGLHLFPDRKLPPAIPISVSMAKPSDLARAIRDADPDKDDDTPVTPSREREPPKPAPPPPPVARVDPAPAPPETLAPPPPPPPPAETPAEKPPEKPLPPLQKVQPLQQQPVTTPPKLPELQKQLPVVQPPPKPAPDKTKTKQVDQDFDQLLNNLTPEVQKADQVSKDKPVHAKPKGGAHAEHLDTQLSSDEMSRVRAAIKACWNVPDEARVDPSTKVDVQVVFNPDMTLKAETIVDTDDRYNRDPVYRAIADSAMRALRVSTCNPLPLSPGRLDQMTITFNPNEM